MIVHVVVACHDRKAMTVQALTCCADSARAAGVTVRFFLFDDGSEDGTAAAVLRLGLDVEVLRGDGNAFWAHGMARAEEAALRERRPEALLWLNDDVRMDQGALTRLKAESDSLPGAILVGAVRDEEVGVISFSGYDRRGRHPLKLDEVAPIAAPRAIDTMNGNIVLVPIEAARRIGGIDGGFSHGLADIDYGLRAKAAGVPVFLGSGTFGTCPSTPDRRYPRDYPTVLTAWKGFTGVKGGGHFRSLVRILRRHAGSAWWYYLVRTYLVWWFRTLGRAAVVRLRGHRSAA